MKILTLLLLISSLAFSKTYYSKVEPYELRDISSSVSGLVLFIDEDNIGKKLSKKPYLQMDSLLDESEVKAIDEKLIYQNDILKANENVLDNLEKSLEKKRENYKRIESLKIKSSVEKDNEFYNLVNSENSYLNTLKEINNLKIQVADLNLRKIQLQRNISDKNLKAEGFVLYSISVKVGQVVGIATPLAKVADISRAKLTIFLDEADVLNIDKKDVYIDGIKSKYKVSRISTIADSVNISKYRAQIIMDAPKLFSKLVKIELKDETTSN